MARGDSAKGRGRMGIIGEEGWIGTPADRLPWWTIGRAGLGDNALSGLVKNALSNHRVSELASSGGASKFSGYETRRWRHLRAGPAITLDNARNQFSYVWFLLGEKAHVRATWFPLLFPTRVRGNRSIHVYPEVIRGYSTKLEFVSENTES